MSHVPAPESTPEASQPESGPVSDRDAQDAREARYAEAIEDGLFRMHGITSSCDHREEGRAVIAVADAELAPLVARVAELEAEVERSRNAHARAIVQLSECMERAEKAEADLLNAWLAVEDVTDEVDRGGSLADYIAALAAAGPASSDGEGATSEASRRPHWNCHDDKCAGKTPCLSCVGWSSDTPASPVVAPSATDEGGCQHAAPFRYCDGCKASPCPIGLGDKS